MLAGHNILEYFKNSLVKKGLNALTKSIDSCQPAQSAQADMSRNFSLFLNVLYVKRQFYLMTKFVCNSDQSTMATLSFGKELSKRVYVYFSEKSNDMEMPLYQACTF